MNSVFLHHKPCPKCGSKDNLAVYSDGHEWCFGCSYFKKGERTLTNSRKEVFIDNGKFDSLNFSTNLPDQPVRWLRKYGISDIEIEQYKLAWIPEKEWLVFPFFENGKLVCINCRNFAEKGQKYYTFGKRIQFHVWGNSNNDTLIFTEDCVSAIKVGRSFATQPILGAHIDSEALFRAAKRFKWMGVWLDANKAKEASRIVSRGSTVLGSRVFRVSTSLDPKEYDNNLIFRTVELSRKGVV